MKIIVKKTDESIEFTLEDASVEDCIKIVKALDNPEPEVKGMTVHHVPSRFLLAAGLELDNWGILLDLKRGILESDVDYRNRLTNTLLGM